MVGNEDYLRQRDRGRGVYDQYGQYQRYRQMSLDDMLLENRIIFLIGKSTTPCDRSDHEDAVPGQPQEGPGDQPVREFAGGAVDDTLAIYDTMQFVGSPIATYCIGRAQSGGRHPGGRRQGSRYALPTQDHAAPALGGVTGQAADIKIQAEEILKAKQTINRLLATTPVSPGEDHGGD